MRFLVLDHDIDEIERIRSLLAGLEKSEDHVFDSRQNLEEGLECLARESFDLVFVGLDLPDARKAQSLIHLQREYPGLAKVVLLRPEEEQEGIFAVRRGAEDFLIRGTYDRSLLSRSIRYAVEKMEYRRSLEEARTTDPVTGTLNREGLVRILERQVAWIRRGMETVAVLLNIEDFTMLNDQLGTSAGNVILKEASTRLQAALRQTDYIARLEGDEFMILLPQTRVAEAFLVASRLRQAAAATPLFLSGRTVQLNARTGIVSISEDSSSLDELLASTRLVMNSRRKSTDARVVYTASPFIEGRKKEKEYLLMDVLNKLKDKENFYVVKQPIIGLEKGAPVGYEFLSRFRMEDFRNPEDFFRMCLENNMLALVDHYCFMNCLSASEAVEKEMRLHFNIFPSTLLDIEVPNLLEDFPENYTRGTACVELSEQQIIGDPSNLEEAVRSFRDAGILVAMDDVGFGKSNLESLIILEPDVVKIDKKCTIGLARNPAMRRSFERLARVLHSLNVETCAEGVETRDDLDIVESFGIKSAQGFYWGQPA